MATLLKLSTLSDGEKDALKRLNRLAVQASKSDSRYNDHYEGVAKLKQIGIAVPPELRHFETLANWNRVYVDEVERRLDVKSLYLPTEDKASEGLREQWEANNLESESPILHRENLIYGRGYVSVGTNSEDRKHPLIRVEPTEQMVSLVSQRDRSMLACMRHYRDDGDGKRKRTLMLPDSTIYLIAGRNGWEIEDRDDHKLGRVSVVLFLNRRRPGRWLGVTEMFDMIPIVNAAARALTNTQVVQEALAVPGRYIFGVDPTKMVDPKTGKPVEVWEAYYTALMAHADKDVKAGQFEAADLENFAKVMRMYGQLASSVSGLPSRYFHEGTVNPAAEGAIIADESRLTKNVERKQAEWGNGWGWVMGLSERFRTGLWPVGNKIRTEWHAAGTPTMSQKTDSIQKLSGGAPILSREGAWDEMGWSDARKDRERGYFEREALDPTLQSIARDLAL